MRNFATIHCTWYGHILFCPYWSFRPNPYWQLRYCSHLPPVVHRAVGISVPWVYVRHALERFLIFLPWKQLQWSLISLISTRLATSTPRSFSLTMKLRYPYRKYLISNSPDPNLDICGRDGKTIQERERASKSEVREEWDIGKGKNREEGREKKEKGRGVAEVWGGVWLDVCAKTRLIDRDVFEICRDTIKIGRDTTPTNHITENWLQCNYNRSRSNCNHIATNYNYIAT